MFSSKFIQNISALENQLKENISDFTVTSVPTIAIECSWYFYTSIKFQVGLNFCLRNFKNVLSIIFVTFLAENQFLYNYRSQKHYNQSLSFTILKYLSRNKYLNNTGCFPIISEITQRISYCRFLSLNSLFESIPSIQAIHFTSHFSHIHK